MFKRSLYSLSVLSSFSSPSHLVAVHTSVLQEKIALRFLGYIIIARGQQEEIT